MADLQNVRFRDLHFPGTFALERGGELPGFSLRVETYGTLNADHSNAVLVCHALSGDHHAAGYYEGDRKPGWWNSCIGPGKPIDTGRFFVVSLNNLGGCAGSTGPTSSDPHTGEPWGPDFPQVTVRDWVRTQAMLADRLDIRCWAAVVGGSLGGMQALQWSIDYPDRLRYCAVIAAAPSLTPQNIAFNEVARQAITSDDHFHEGRYQSLGHLPRRGLAIARMLGHITYLSDEAMNAKFDPKAWENRDRPGLNRRFPIISYLHHQGDTFTGRFDANTYVLMTRVLDYFNPARDHGDDLVRALSRCCCRFLVISFSSDWRFSPKRSEEIADALVSADKPVVYMEIRSDQGHDAFLLDNPEYHRALRTWMNRIADELEAGAAA
jgi:homoserine O-acetyltransferase